MMLYSTNFQYRLYTGIDNRVGNIIYVQVHSSQCSLTTDVLSNG